MLNNFNIAEAAAKARGDTATAKRIDMERRMAVALVDHALGQGWSVSVNDGEEWTLVKSDSYTAIFDALFTTDEDLVMLREANGDKIGCFALVYGNDGYDVIADHSDNDACNEIWETVINPLAYTLEREA